MKMFKIIKPITGLFQTVLILVVVLTTSSWANVRVSAELSSASTAVGQPVELRIMVEGSSDALVPQQIAINNLDVQYTGRSIQMNMVNFQFSHQVSYNYLVVPRSEGEFEIPSFEVRVQNRTYRTEPLRLSVSGHLRLPAPPPVNPYRPPAPSVVPPASPPAQPQNQPTSIEEIVFAELIVPEETAFVGQKIPVEIRLYFDQRFRFEVRQAPAFSGEGFTVERLAEPVHRQQVVDGVPFQVYTFYSAVTPVKTGLLEITPAEMRCGVVVPRRGGSFLDDFFGDVFGGMMSPFNEVQEVEVSSNGAQIEVLPVPREDRPASFAGAIGSFSLESDASPRRAGDGDPITMKIQVSGQGNFHALQQPELTDTEGWRVYPGSDSFTPTDVTGFSGTKTFEVMLVARENKTATPGVEFSYFDPAQRKFFTLEAEPVPVEVTGVRPAVAAAPAAVGTPQEEASKDGTAEQSVADAASLPPLQSKKIESFTPLPLRSSFLAMNAVVAGVWLILCAWVAAVLWKGSDVGILAARRKSLKRTFHQIQKSGLSPSDFYSQSAGLLEQWGNTPDHSSLLGQIEAKLGVEARQTVDTIFRRRDELKFGLKRELPENQFRTEQALILPVLQSIIRL